METLPILVIDDDPRFCEFVTEALTDSGFEVHSAPDGPSGIELARIAQPAIILLDMMMAGMDGISTLQCLKREPTLEGIPVIGVSASTDLSYTEKAFRANAELFLAKPFGAQSLIQALNLALQNAKPGPHGRRRHPRFFAELPARCLVFEGGKATREVNGYTGNVSLGGVLARLTEPLALSTTVRLDLGLPSHEIVSIEGRVVWQNDELRKLTVPHGVQFLGFLDDAAYLEYRHTLSEIAARDAAR